MTDGVNLQDKKRVLLCAGGTGGHLFPAHALASELQRRGFEIHLVSDERIDRFAEDFPADFRHSVPSATLAGKSIIKLAKALYALGVGYLEGRRLVRDTKPDVVVGFGGYPTVPPVFAAATKGVPTIIHEANAVLGRANKFLSRSVKSIALGLPLQGNSFSKAINTGNPVRDAVHDAAKVAYKTPSIDDKFALTVFGGSQGAQFFSATLPKAIGLMSETHRKRLHLVQQARNEDEQALRSAYDVMAISAEVNSFFNDMPMKIAESHFVICRSGASTTAELAVIGRPALLVPYPFALDHDQAANAAALLKGEGAFVRAQADITPEWLAEELATLMDDPERLTKLAHNAKAQGQPDATLKLANAVALLADGKTPTNATI